MKVVRQWFDWLRRHPKPQPAFNHTREDGPYDPCPICRELMTRIELKRLERDE